MRHAQTIKLENGKVEMFLQEYKIMTLPVYYAYTLSGHCIGYSSNFKIICKRLDKYLKEREEIL